MILTLIVSLYITFICRCYGGIVLLIIKKITREKYCFPLEFIPTCFTGLAAIGTLFLSVSLILPLGGMIAQAILILPALVYIFLVKFKFSILRAKTNEINIPAILKLTLFACFLLVLIMHAWTINHPDTLNYHAQNIQWIEKYKAIPGTANLYLMYGLQSSWFALSALFSFKCLGTAAFTFINATVLLWFVIFVIGKINDILQKKNEETIYFFPWLSFLIVSFWSYTQIRLFATSGSPDFIAALYLWLIFYLFVNYQKQKQTSLYLLILFLSFFSITIKLQSLPVILFSLFCYYKFARSKVYSKLFLSALIGLIVILPLLVRNIISSGYLLFPSDFPDLFSFDWKANKDFMIINQQYITSYARANVSFSLDPLSHDYHMKTAEWLPVWWSLRSWADKLIISGIPVSAILLSICHKRIFTKENNPLIALLFFLIPGILFWFIKAPDPRFGFGFLIPFIAVTIHLLINGTKNKFLNNKLLLTVSLLLFSSGLIAYSAYRLKNYFSIKNILEPAGISSVPYRQINCNGAIINFPLNDEDCGDSPVPCARIKCDSVVQRSAKFEDGFRIKK